MNRKFIFFTSHGFPLILNKAKTENCFVLGWTEGKTPDEAYQKLIKKNDDFSILFSDIVCQELNSEEVYKFPSKL